MMINNESRSVLNSSFKGPMQIYSIDSLGRLFAWLRQEGLGQDFRTSLGMLQAFRCNMQLMSGFGYV